MQSSRTHTQAVYYLTSFWLRVRRLMQFTRKQEKSTNERNSVCVLSHLDKASANFSIYIAIMTPWLQFGVFLLSLLWWLLFFEEMLIEWMRFLVVACVRSVCVCVCVHMLKLPADASGEMMRRHRRVQNIHDFASIWVRWLCCFGTFE